MRSKGADRIGLKACLGFGCLLLLLAGRIEAQGVQIARSELYGMKLVKATSLQEEVWQNTNKWAVTAVWKWTRKGTDKSSAGLGTTGKTEQVFQPGEKRPVSFPADAETVLIVMAYKDATDRLIQGNAADDWQSSGPDVDVVGGEPSIP